MLLPALVITRIADGREGSRRLWERIVKVRVVPAWYVFALVVLPAPAIIMAFLFFGGPDRGASVSAALVYGFVVQGVIVFVTNNLWEEIAVMGFLQARLQDRHGPLKAAALTALYFTFQHIALIIASGVFAALLLFLVTAFGFRALMAWTYNKTDSLFIVGLTRRAMPLQAAAGSSVQESSASFTRVRTLLLASFGGKDTHACLSSQGSRAPQATSWSTAMDANNNAR
jgi:membrane protease YdiL (CAAX protease family)